MESAYTCNKTTVSAGLPSINMRDLHRLPQEILYQGVIGSLPASVNHTGSYVAEYSKAHLPHHQSASIRYSAAEKALDSVTFQDFPLALPDTQLR